MFFKLFITRLIMSTSSSHIVGNVGRLFFGVGVGISPRSFCTFGSFIAALISSSIFVAISSNSGFEEISISFAGLVKYFVIYFCSFNISFPRGVLALPVFTLIFSLIPNAVAA